VLLPSSFVLLGALRSRVLCRDIISPLAGNKQILMGCKACQKPKVQYRKGLWSPEEDEKLRDYILRYGHGCWSALPLKAGKKSSHASVHNPP